MNYIERVKSLCDEIKTAVTDKSNKALVGKPDVEALTAVIDMLTGKSAEADVLENEVSTHVEESYGEYSYKDSCVKELNACKSGALAIRAVPKLTQENTRLREALANIANNMTNLIHPTEEALEAVARSVRAEARAALRGEGANNER